MDEIRKQWRSGEFLCGAEKTESYCRLASRCKQPKPGHHKAVTVLINLKLNYPATNKKQREQHQPDSFTNY
jgi:hypothetical protein